MNIFLLFKKKMDNFNETEENSKNFFSSLKFKILQSMIFQKINYLILLFVFFSPIKPYLGKKLIMFTFILWLISVDYKNLVISFKNSKTLLLIFIFCFYTMLSMFWSDNIYSGLKWIESQSIYFFIPVLIIATSKSELLVKRIIVVFIVSMIINEIISYGIFFNLIDNIFGFHVNGDISNPLPFQVSHIPYSTYVGFAILLSLYKIFFEKVRNIYLTLITIFFAITMTINLFLSMGRTGQFCIIMTLFSLLIIYQKNIKNSLISVGLIVLIFIAAYEFGNTFHQRVDKGINDIQEIYQNNNFNTSWGVRLGGYVLLDELLKENNIIIGTGIGDIQDFVLEVSESYFGENSIFSVQKGLLHNTFLEILITYGFVGFSLFILIFYYLFNIKLNTKEMVYIRYILVFFIIYSGLSANMFTFKEFMFLYAIFISIIIKVELDDKIRFSQDKTLNKDLNE